MGGAGLLSAASSWGNIAQQTREHVPEWRGRQRFETVEKMLNDGQIDSLYTGTIFPLEEYDFWLDLNGCDEAATRAQASDLGLPVGDADGPTDDTVPWRREDAFDFRDHLHELLLAPCFGAYMFELEGDYRDGLWRLDGIYPRHPSTIAKVEQDSRTGKLIEIRQDIAFVRERRGVLYAGQAPPIPAVRLVPYVWRPDATRRWEGRSIVRPLFRNYLCKDILLRIDVDNHEKAGGIPVVRTDHTFAGGSLAELGQLASEMRISEDAGAALPPGAWIEMLMAGNSNRMESVRYHDEQMSKVWHRMVSDLGSTPNGSRALGQTMSDDEALARRAIAAWACRIFKARVIDRMWFWNYGEQPTAPVLRHKPPAIEGSDDPVEEEAERSLTAIAARTGGPRPTKRDVRAAADRMRVERVESLGAEWRGCAA